MNEKQFPQQDVPDALMQKLDQWRQDNPQATLTEIEEAVEGKLAALRKELVERIAGADVASSQEVPGCPCCKQQMVKNGRKKRKLRSKEGQIIELERQQWRCLGCGTTLFPPG
jgi:transposase-like protein